MLCSDISGYLKHFMIQFYIKYFILQILGHKMFFKGYLFLWFILTFYGKWLFYFFGNCYDFILFIVIIMEWTSGMENTSDSIWRLRKLFIQEKIIDPKQQDLISSIGDDSLFSKILDKYDGDVEVINKVIIFAKLVNLKLDNVLDFFNIDDELERYNIKIVDIIKKMDKKILDQLRRLLFKNKITVEQFMLFTGIKNWGLSDNTFEIVSSIIRKWEEWEWGDDRKKDNYSVLSALLSHYHNKMLMTEWLTMGDIKEKIVWFDNLNKNGDIDSLLEHKNFKDLMQRYRNRRIVALLCKIFWHDNVFEKDLEKVNKKLGFDISYLDEYL